MDNKKQKEVFKKGEGDAWYERNKNNIAIKNQDPVVDILNDKKLNLKNILEIGCSNGWRLRNIQELFRIDCYGIDPSKKAIMEGLETSNKINLKQGTADEIPFGKLKFDVIIFGFCLYLCDRDDLFKIVAEADYRLRDGGYIIIHDFEPPIPYKNVYHHKKDVFSYKMNYSQLFLSNPHYSMIDKCVYSHNENSGLNNANERVSVQLMMKNKASAYILNPYG